MENPFLISADTATANNFLGHMLLESVSHPQYKEQFKKACAQSSDGYFDVRIVMNGQEFPLTGFAESLAAHWDEIVQTAAAKLARAPAVEIVSRITDKLHDMEKDLDRALASEFPEYTPEWYQD